MPWLKHAPSSTDLIKDFSVKIINYSKNKVL